MPERLLQTPSQTVGPYFAYGLTARQYGYDWDQLTDRRMVRDSTPGRHIRVSGQVLDGAGEPVDDALIEVWQADAEGRYPGPEAFADPDAFHGFGRCGTGTADGATFTFETVMPGSHDGEAPHLNVIVLMRGLLLHLFTRAYFPDDAAALQADPILASVPEARRGTLIAKRIGADHYCFDIHLQGDEETVFFDV